MYSLLHKLLLICFFTVWTSVKVIYLFLRIFLVFLLVCRLIIGAGQLITGAGGLLSWIAWSLKQKWTNNTSVPCTSARSSTSTSERGSPRRFDLAYQSQIHDIVKVELKRQPSHFPKVSENYECYKVYCKGFLLDLQTVKASFGGIGVAICDINGRQVSEVQKVVSVSRSMVARHVVVELEAMIEGLNAAVELGLKRVHVCSDNVSVYRYLSGELRPTKRSVMTLVDKFTLIRRTFDDCGLYRVRLSGDIKFASELARDAIIFQPTNFEEDTFGKTLVEECTICYHEIEWNQMFIVNKCLHKYCLPCMRKHVEAKLLQWQLPGCPHENCKSKLQIKSCKKFLTPELYNIMSMQVKEATIPQTEKVYCPFPNCSELMSKTEVLKYTESDYKISFAALGKGLRKCSKCQRQFCTNCKAPWHEKISCSDYMKKNKYGNEAKLKSLAARNKWRQCSRCKNIVELAEGCYHINCRCGNEFCYTCGAEYIRKKSTCKCPLWDESRIIYRQQQQNRRLRN